MVHPKPDGERRRRNAVVAMTHLPAEGYQGPIPDWPLIDGGTFVELERWNRLWRTPVAAMWVQQVGTELVVARYVRNCIMIEDAQGGKTTIAVAHLHSEIRQLEDRLGLNPLALLRLRWQVVENEVEDQRVQRGPRERLKAVDPSIVNE